MHWKYSANAGFFGLRRDRFNQYQPPRSLEEKIALVARTDGITGIELKYPADFSDVDQVQVLLAKHNLLLNAINVDTKDFSRFHHGALSARDSHIRQQAIDQLCAAMDLAAELQVSYVTTCPLAEAYDYPFQVDYRVAWDNFIESVHRVVAHRDDVTLLLEYQPHEPHAHILLNNVGKVMMVMIEVGADNLGANLDIGHSFAAGEAPAEAAALLHRAGRLHYIHSNDNTGDGGDWDMISGSVHLWHWLELLYTLRRIGYNGWIGGDIMPKLASPDAYYSANVQMIERMTTWIVKHTTLIEQYLNQQYDPAAMYESLSRLLFE